MNTTEAIGYHGTTRSAVPRILAGDITMSDRRFEWLGKGFYLWQDSPWRALEWARDHYGNDNAAVVVAKVDLQGCLDLLDPSWQRLLRDADAAFVTECLAAGVSVPKNLPSGARNRDCATINWFCDQVIGSGASHIRSVRAILEEGDPIFEASAIRSQSHVQLAVRDLTAIVGMEEVTL